jgi:CHASE3 domain sensor protein
VAVVIVVLILDLTSTIWGIAQLSGLNATIQQKDLPLRSDSDALLAALLNEETGLRGYLLADDPAFEVPLNAGRAAVHAAHRQTSELNRR